MAARHEVGGMGRGPENSAVEGLYCFTCSCTVPSPQGERHWRTAWGTFDQAVLEIKIHFASYPGERG